MNVFAWRDFIEVNQLFEPKGKLAGKWQANNEVWNLNVKIKLDMISETNTQHSTYYMAFKLYETCISIIIQPEVYLENKRYFISVNCFFRRVRTGWTG